jgi:hypothetical protein
MGKDTNTDYSECLLETDRLREIMRGKPCRIEDITRLALGFWHEELFSESVLRESLKIPDRELQLCKYFVYQAIEFFNGRLPAHEFDKCRSLSHALRNYLEKNSLERKLLQATHCLLYGDLDGTPLDDEESWLQVDEGLYDDLFAMGPGYCTRLTDYIEKMQDNPHGNLPAYARYAPLENVWQELYGAFVDLCLNRPLYHDFRRHSYNDSSRLTWRPQTRHTFSSADNSRRAFVFLDQLHLREEVCLSSCVGFCRDDAAAKLEAGTSIVLPVGDEETANTMLAHWLQDFRAFLTINREKIADFLAGKT